MRSGYRAWVNGVANRAHVLRILALWAGVLLMALHCKAEAEHVRVYPDVELRAMDSLMEGLYFQEAERYVSNLSAAVEKRGDCWINGGILSSWGRAQLGYVAHRRGDLRDSLELLYEELSFHSCAWGHCQLGMLLGKLYILADNPIMALMYVRASLQEALQLGDSAAIFSGMLMESASYLQLGDVGTADSIFLAVGRYGAGREQEDFSLLRALLLARRGEARDAAMLLDTLRDALYRGKRLLKAGYVARLGAELRLAHGDIDGALALLHWADAFPSQGTEASVALGAWDVYGRCYAAKGENKRAIGYYGRALADANSQQNPLRKVKVLLGLSNVYQAERYDESAFQLKQQAVALRDSVLGQLPVKFVQSEDNIRKLNEKKLKYGQELRLTRRDNQQRMKGDWLLLLLLAFVILIVEVITFRLWRVFIEKGRQKMELQKFTDTLQRRGQALRDQGKRLEEMHAESLRQTNRLSRVHASMQSNVAKIMHSVVYASAIQRALLPSASDSESVFVDSFFILRAQQVVSGDLYWLGHQGGETVAAMVDCTGNGISGASLSFIAYMLLNAVVLERGVQGPKEIIEGVDAELRQLLSSSDQRFHGVVGMEMSVLTINASTRVVRFCGVGHQLLYSLDGRSVLRFRSRKGRVVGEGGRDSAWQEAIISYCPGASFYMQTDGYVNQLNAEQQKMGTPRLIALLERVLHLPMQLQQQAVLGAYARHRLAESQTDDITMVGMRLE